MNLCPSLVSIRLTNKNESSIALQKNFTYLIMEQDSDSFENDEDFKESYLDEIEALMQRIRNDKGSTSDMTENAKFRLYDMLKLKEETRKKLLEQCNQSNSRNFDQKTNNLIMVINTNDLENFDNSICRIPIEISPTLTPETLD